MGLLDERIDNRLGVSTLYSGEHHVAGVTLNQRGNVTVVRTEQEISLPVARHCPVCYLGRPLTDRHSINYAGDNKPFIVLTSAVPISMIAGLIATAAIAYESLKEGTVPVRCWGAFALAVAAYAFGDFVIRDYASGYSILQ